MKQARVSEKEEDWLLEKEDLSPCFALALMEILSPKNTFGDVLNALLTFDISCVRQCLT